MSFFGYNNTTSESVSHDDDEVQIVSTPPDITRSKRSRTTAENDDNVTDVLSPQQIKRRRCIKTNVPVNCTEVIDLLDDEEPSSGNCSSSSAPLSANLNKTIVWAKPHHIDPVNLRLITDLAQHPSVLHSIQQKLSDDRKLSFYGDLLLSNGELDTCSLVSMVGCVFPFSTDHRKQFRREADGTTPVAGAWKETLVERSESFNFLDLLLYIPVTLVPGHDMQQSHEEAGHNMSVNNNYDFVRVHESSSDRQQVALCARICNPFAKTFVAKMDSEHNRKMLAGGNHPLFLFHNFSIQKYRLVKQSYLQSRNGNVKGNPSTVELLGFMPADFDAKYFICAQRNS